jgi:transposase
VNPLFRDVLAHYGVVALPCRIQDPDRKGKVESGIGHTQKTPLKGMRFNSLEEAQAYLDRWEQRWADTRPEHHRGANSGNSLSWILPVAVNDSVPYGLPERQLHVLFFAGNTF